MTRIKDSTITEKLEGQLIASQLKLKQMESNLLLVRQHLADALTEKVKYDQVIGKLMESSNIEIRESVKSLMTSTKASFSFVLSKDHERLDIVQRPIPKG